MLIPSGLCGSLQNQSMGIRGPKHTALARIETPISESGGADSGALSGDSPQSSSADPDLDQVLRVWPTLCEDVRGKILELINGGDHRGPTD